MDFCRDYQAKGYQGHSVEVLLIGSFITIDPLHLRPPSTTQHEFIVARVRM